MAQQLRVFSALPEDRGLIPSTYMVTYNICNFSSRASDVFSWPLWAPGIHVAHIHIQTTLIHIQIKINLLKMYLGAQIFI